MPDTAETAHIKAPRSMAHLLRTTLMAVGILSLLLSVVGAALLFQHAFAEQFDTDLSRTVEAIAVGYEHSADPQPEQLAQYADGLRLTLVAQDGTVLYDSATADPSTLPNHANRPEIQQAMAEGTGASVRRSATLGYDTHYYAVRLTDGSVLRLADETSNMWSSYNRVLPVLVAGCILIIILALVLAQVITKHLVQPITRMAEHLDCIEANVPYEELIPLAHTVQSDRKLREDNETIRREFTANVSHELKTPLTSISGNALILTEKNPLLTEEKRRELSAAIYEDANWLNHLVENLLSITRMENGQVNLRIQPELIQDIFDDVLTHLDHDAARHTIVTNVADDLLMADMDAQLIEQVLVNLINNAIKYTPEHSRIELFAAPEGKFVRICVTDDGPGIPEESRDKLFDMFYTLGKTRSDGRRGLGLGLALCRSIVAAHGGVIDVQNAAPHGACFRFTLPRTEVTLYE